MGFVFRVLWLFVLVLFLRWVFSKLMATVFPRVGPPPAQIHGIAHKDPQCGLYIAEELAVVAQVGGHKCYFCSAGCRDRFLAGSKKPIE
jgi:YHS domain-containing protein